MKITIERSILLERLAQVVKAIDSKCTVPILEGVLIESNMVLTLTGADQRFSITTTISEYEEHKSGSVVIPAKKLLEIVKKLPNKPITITIDGAQAIIQAGAKVKLPAMDAEEYPRRAFPSGNMAEVSGKELSRLVDNTKFAVSTNEATPILCGLNIMQKDGQLTILATDRHRLAKQSSGPISDLGLTAGRTYTVDVKPLEAAAHLNLNTLEIGLSDNEIFIRTGDYQFISTLLDGTYPDTSKIIPKEPKIKVLVNTQQLLKTLELADKIVDDKTKVIALSISEGELFVSAKDITSGMEESLEAEVEGEEIKLSANCKYMIDALKCITTELVLIELTGIMAPIIIKGEGDDTGLHLVLPYRTIA